MPHACILRMRVLVVVVLQHRDIPGVAVSVDACGLVGGWSGVLIGCGFGIVVI